MNVALDGEARIIDPQRPSAEQPGHVQTPPQLRDELESTFEVVGDLLQAQTPLVIQQRLALQHGEAAEVTRPLGCLEA